MNIQMEGLPRAEYLGRGLEPPCPLWAHHSPALPRVHQPGSSLDPLRWGVLWRFLQVGMISYIFLAPLPSLENERWGKNSKLLIVAWSSWRPPLIPEYTKSHFSKTKDISVTQEIPGYVRA